MDRAPTCCQNGWRQVFAGSCFTHGDEADFSPTVGESLAVAWSLNHARMFVQGCETLIIVTDHKPLLGIFNNRELSNKIQHNPGNGGADAFSRYPAHLEK